MFIVFVGFIFFRLSFLYDLSFGGLGWELYFVGLFFNFLIIEEREIYLVMVIVVLSCINLVLCE